MKNILIVDDATVTVDILTDILTEHNYNVIGSAGNGHEGFEKYKELKPDLVIMDITMPNVDGIKGIELIKSFDPNAKIIICSAQGQRKMMMKAFQMGAGHYIIKPFNDETVLKTVNKALGFS